MSEGAEGRTELDLLAVSDPDDNRGRIKTLLALPTSDDRTAAVRLMVERGLAALERRDYEFSMMFLHPTDYACRLEPGEHLLPPDVELEYRGREGFERMARSFRDSWEDYSCEITQIVDGGKQRFVIELHLTGRLGLSGLEVSENFGQIVEFRDGWLVGHTHFQAFPEALAAAQKNVSA